MKKLIKALLLSILIVGHSKSQTDASAAQMQALMENMHYDQAIAFADSCKNKDENILLMQAKACYNLGRLSEAIGIYREIERISPLRTEVYQLEAEAWKQMKKYTAATDALQKGYKHTQSILLGENLAQMLLYIDQDSAAIAMTDRLLERGFLPPIIRIKAKALRKTGKPEQAAELLVQQMKKDSTDFLSLIDLSTLYKEMGETRLIEQSTADYLKYDSSNIAILSLHAESLMMLQSPDSARMDYDRMIAAGGVPPTFKDLFFCGLSNYKADKWDIAETYLAQADSLAYEQNYWAKYYWAMCAFHQGKWQEAEKRLHATLELIKPQESRLTEIYTHLGHCANEQNHISEAISHLRYAIEYDSGNSDASLLLGQCFEKDGNTKGAIKMYERVIEKEKHTSASIDKAGFSRLGEAEIRLSRLQNRDPE